MTDDELRKIVANIAQAANTAALAESQRLDANTKGLSESRRLPNTALTEESASDRFAFIERARESDRQHLAAAELVQQIFGEIQHINQRLAG